MDPPFTVVRVTGQRVTPRATADTTLVKEYRRDRQHLYSREEYQDALATGGIVWSFCGIHDVVQCGDASDVAEATEPDADDCVTCVDIWRECQWFVCDRGRAASEPCPLL